MFYNYRYSSLLNYESRFFHRHIFALSIKKMENTKHDSSSSNIFLTGTILLANLDFAGLMDYAIKALIGGAIWLGYKATADYIERKRKKE
jgi:hypothetical protein